MFTKFFCRLSQWYLKQQLIVTVIRVGFGVLIRAALAPLGRWSRQRFIVTAISMALVVLISLAFAVQSLSEPVAQAQGGTFDSGSNGSDGALSITAPGTYIFDPRTFNPQLDQDGDNIYHFTTITIGPGVIVRLRGPELNMSPVFWLATGAVQIDGTIDLNGEDGHAACGIPADRSPAVPGAGGYLGGIGGITVSPSQPGTGPGGAASASSAGHAENGTGPIGPIPAAAYGNDFLVPLLGGSGGGGGNGDPAAGGGAGGGALLIASSESITVNGAILADGGDQPNSQWGNGSGGAIHLMGPSIGGTGTLRAFLIESGSGGRIRLDAFQHQFTGNASPTPILGSPFEVFLPADQPSVRVIDVAGATVPEVPTNSFASPDTTINTASPATVMIEAENVPLGTVVQVYVYSENGPDQIVDSTPLAGTLELSTATATVTIPSGFSRMFVRTKWTP